MNILVKADNYFLNKPHKIQIFGQCRHVKKSLFELNLNSFGFSLRAYSVQKYKGSGRGSQQIWIADTTRMRRETFYSADSSLQTNLKLILQTEHFSIRSGNNLLFYCIQFLISNYKNESDYRPKKELFPFPLVSPGYPICI